MLDQMRRAPLHKYGNVTILAWGNEITTFRIETLCVPDPARVYRVAQWATGRIGTAALRELIRSPQFELVGVYVHSAEKDGQDAGTLCGLPPTGAKATRDIATIRRRCRCRYQRRLLHGVQRQHQIQRVTASRCPAPAIC